MMALVYMIATLIQAMNHDV